MCSTGKPGEMPNPRRGTKVELSHEKLMERVEKEQRGNNEKEHWSQSTDERGDTKCGRLNEENIGPEEEKPSQTTPHNPGGRRKQSFHGEGDGVGDSFIPIGLQK